MGQEQKDNKLFVSTLLLVVLHVVGLTGLLSYKQDLFLLLTPINLLLCATVIFINHKNFNTSFYIFCIITFLAVFFIEVVGVKTGLIFGEYSYGKTLGYKIANVPFIIGLNWLILIYSAGVICNQLNTNIYIKSTLGALMLVTLDFFIEPVAIKYDFWSWNSSSIPLQNYSSWFIASFLLLLFFYKTPFEKNNKLARTFYIIQFVFFILLSTF